MASNPTALFASSSAAVDEDLMDFRDEFWGQPHNSFRGEPNDWASEWPKLEPKFSSRREHIPFLTFPREIRDMVYVEALGDLCEPSCPDGARRLKYKHALNARLLTVSKQINVECEEYMQRHMQFSYSNVHTLVQALKIQSVYRRTVLHKPMTAGPVWISSITHLQLTFTIMDLLQLGGTDPLSRRANNMWPAILSGFKRLPLKDLTIFIPHPTDNDDDLEWRHKYCHSQLVRGAVFGLWSRIQSHPIFMSGYIRPADAMVIHDTARQSQAFESLGANVVNQLGPACLPNLPAVWQLLGSLGGCDCSTPCTDPWNPINAPTCNLLPGMQFVSQHRKKKGRHSRHRAPRH